MQLHGLPMKFARQEYWSGLSFPSSGDLPNPGIEPRSPTLQADSFPAESQGKPKNTGVGSLSLLQQTFPTQGSNWGLLHCRWILYQLSYQGSPFFGCEQRKIPHVQGQRRIPRKIVGGAKSQLESNPIPARDTRRAQTKPCVHQDSEPR